MRCRGKGGKARQGLSRAAMMAVGAECIGTSQGLALLGKQKPSLRSS
ncbi:MAG: hypothetical protein JMJ93_10300 [Synergistaceae bacterium]|nr:hypothetical protein [Synergistaceae bacterium]